MREFFAAIRHILSVTESKFVLGGIVHQAIQERILPRLRQQAERAGPDEAEELNELIAQYEIYSNPRTNESRIYNLTAIKVLIGAAKSYNILDEDLEDIGQQIAANFYLRGNWMASFDQFDHTEGPVRLNKFWGRIISNQIKMELRTMSSFTLKTIRPRRLDEDIENIPESRKIPQQEASLDEKFLREIYRNLLAYVRRKAKDDLSKLIFKVWMDEAKQRGGDKVIMERDVYPEVTRYLESQGKEAPKKSYLNRKWLEVRRLIIRFFEKEMDMTITDDIKKKLKLSSEQVLTYEWFRRRTAAWVLSGITNRVTA